MKSKTIIGLTLILLMMIGIITTVLAVINIQNYERPYFFALIFGGLGIWVGVKITNRFKSIIALNQRMKTDFWQPIMYISTGIMGIFMLTASYVNNETAQLVSCEDYHLIIKHRKEGGFRDPEINSLYFIIDGQKRRIICNHKYWDNVRVGQKINICVYESKINFDFISIYGKE